MCNNINVRLPFDSVCDSTRLGYDVPLLSRTLDWISVMAYDYHGQWDKKTGHVAPMYSHPDDFDMTYNAVLDRLIIPIIIIIVIFIYYY